MHNPINPSPVTGGACGELPAYLSNGVIGLRVRDNPLTAGMTLVSGLTGRHPVKQIEAAALAPYPLAMELALDDIWTSDAVHAIRPVDQAYDFATAELTTRLAYQPAGVRADLEIVTLCCRADPTIVCQELTLRLSGKAKVSLRALVDARGVDGEALAFERADPAGEITADGWLLWRTSGGYSTCGVASLSQLTGAEAQASRPPLQRGRLVTQFDFAGDGVRTYRLRTTVSVVPSALHAQPDQQAVRLLGLAVRKGFDSLRAETHKAWQDLWRSRIRLAGADERWQALADATFFYMMTSTHPSSPASTSIFGLSTWSNYHYYYGHVMWDLETFAVPPLAFLQPGAAEALLDYRSRNLEPARRNAQTRGRRGLQFPWESSPGGGEEASPLPGTASWHEDHVTPDVARAFALYAAVSGKDDFARGKAWPVLSGAADWLASRTTRTARGHEIKASMGIAERETESDNPAFAIFAAQAAFDDALAMAERLGLPAPPQWREVRDGLVAPMRGKLIVSHDGYRSNETKGATPDPLMALFPLWRDLDPEVVRNTLGYYLASAEDYIGAPMLSALFGVWAAWSGDRALSERLLDEGYAQFLSGRFDQVLEYRPDKFPEQPQAGPFVANMGGFLSSLIMGFPGLRPTLDVPATWACRPVVLPRGWDAIEIDQLWVRGEPWRLRAQHGAERAELSPA